MKKTIRIFIPACFFIHVLQGLAFSASGGLPAWAQSFPTGCLSALAVMFLVLGILFIKYRKSSRNIDLLKYLAFSVSEIFWITDRNWKKIYYISPSYEKIFGRKCDEVYADPMAWLESVFPDHKEAVIDQVAGAHKALSETRFPRFRITTPDGTERWISARVLPLLDKKGRIIRMAGIAEDVTRRVNAEAELSRNIKKYRELVDNMQDVVYRCGLDGILTMISPSVTKILGYENEEECLGRNIAEDFYYNPEERQEYIRMLHLNGSVTDYEVTLKRKDGSPVIVATSSHLYYDDQGNAAGIEGIVRDITGRKRAEELFNKAFMENPCAMSVSDIATGTYVEVNKTYMEILGYTRDEVIGHNVYDLNIYNHPEDRQRVVEAMRNHGRAYNLEIEFLTKNGEIKIGLFFGEIIQITGRNMLLTAVLNITEQRLAERAYMKSEERFRRLAENAPDVIYRMKLPEGIYEYVNPSSLNVLGYTPDEIYASPMLVAQTIHPGWREYFAEQWEKLLRGIVPPFYEYKIIAPDGTEKWLHQRNMLITGEDGSPQALEGIVTDITERKKAEEDVRFKNLILATELDVSIDGILVVDSGGTIVLFNRRFRDIWGVPEDVLVPMMDEIVLEYVKQHVAEPDEFMGRVRYLYDHAEEKSYDEFRMKDGRVIDRYSVPMISSDGKNFGRVWYFRDITERKKIEETLRSSEKKLLEAEKISQTGNWELHLDGWEIYGSDGARDLYGLEPGRWDFSHVQSMVLPEYRASLNEELRAMLQDGKPYDVEFKIRRGTDGKIIDIHSIAEFDPERRIVFGTIQDITERKRIDDELQKLKNYLANIIDSIPSILVGIDPEMNITLLNRYAEKMMNIKSGDAAGKPLYSVLDDFSPWIDTLHSSVAGLNQASIPDILIEKNGERHFYNLMLYPVAADGIEGAVLRIDDITEAKRKEEQLVQAQKMETVGTLAGGLAHDFNNVLSGIMGTVTLIKHRLDRGDIQKDQLFKWIDLINRSSSRAAEMVNRLLVLSRRHDLNLVPMDINTAVNNVMQICGNSFDKSVEITAACTQGNAMIQGSPAQIEQVILNICVNAAHSMTIMRDENEPRGGRLDVSVKMIKADHYFCTAHPEAREGIYWLISCSDTGIGMDSSIINKIYDPFFTTKEKGEGTGLGLAMVYNIIHQHNGFLDVYSEPGVGSTFNVYLPAYLTGDDNIAASEEQEIVKGEGLILVIDDEEIVRLIAENILTECGYSVIPAEDGRRGIELFREKHESISAVLLDMAMPGMSGDLVYAELKKIQAGVRVLLSSGFRQDARVEKVMSAGISGFIQKPYSIVEMSRKMKEVLGQG